MLKFKLLFCLIVASLTLSAQTTETLKKEIERLLEENTRLREKLEFCDVFNHSNQFETKSFSSKFDFKVLACKGLRIDQVVEIEVLITHNLPHQKMSLYTGSEAPVAYGEMGDSFELREVKFSHSKTGFGVERFMAPTGIPIKGKLTFRNILPSTDRLSLVTGTFLFQNQDGGGNEGEGSFEIRNLTIDWD